MEDRSQDYLFLEHYAYPYYNSNTRTNCKIVVVPTLSFTVTGPVCRWCRWILSTTVFILLASLMGLLIPLMRTF